jgi:signal transduction histidine kinase
MGDTTSALRTALDAAVALGTSASLVRVALAWVRRRRGGPLPVRGVDVSAATAVCAVLSLVTSFALPGGEAGSGWKMVHVLLFLPLIAAVTRWSAPRELRPSVVLASLAVALWPVPLAPGGSPLESTGIATVWLLPALAAVAAGAHFRRQQDLRERAVLEARRSQRLQLSRDLHDFVAHDISGIVVQAQAARFVAASDPGQAVLALERIEKAGLSALSAMDRTMDMLDPDGTASALPSVSQLPSLTADFSASGATRVDLRMPPELPEALPRELGAAAYRIVVEALTNIRRHSPAATRAEVALALTGDALELSVTNDGVRPRSRPFARRRGGRGVPALTELARTLGGSLTVGPEGGTGWRLSARLPLAPGPAAARTPRPTSEKST